MVYKIEPYEQSITTAETPDYGAQIAELAKQIEALKTRLGGKNLNEL